MTRRATLPLLVCFLWHLVLHFGPHAQQLRGRVVSAATGRSVPFASVGVEGRPLGSTADEAGRFTFADAPALTATDSVVISCVGYQSLRLGQLRGPEATWQLRYGPHWAKCRCATRGCAPAGWAPGYPSARRSGPPRTPSTWQTPGAGS